jgi:dephospho-CoA kinase
MRLIVAVTGLSCVGKTTAIEHFERLGLGLRVYLGKIVLDEIRERGLWPISSNESLVRLELREKEGPAFLVRRSVGAIEECITTGYTAFIDAIFHQEEFDYLRSSFPGCKVVMLGIEAEFNIRALRAASRAERRMTLDELESRDKIELSRLKTPNIVNRSDHRVFNNSTMENFETSLDLIWTQLTKR